MTLVLTVFQLNLRLMTAFQANKCNRLFVYGTLAPGRENEHLLRAIGGHWQPGTVRGLLFPEGIGPTRGFPVLQLDREGPIVSGLVFTSRRLPAYWSMLDEFEGAGYRRTPAWVRLRHGSRLQTWVYAFDEANFGDLLSGNRQRRSALTGIRIRRGSKSGCMLTS